MLIPIWNTNSERNYIIVLFKQSESVALHYFSVLQEYTASKQ